MSPSPLLTAQTIYDFIARKEGFITRREIADHFHIKGEERIHLKVLLKEMVEKKTLLKKGKSYQVASDEDRATAPSSAGGLITEPQDKAGSNKPHKWLFVEARVCETDNQGEVILKPLTWDDKAEAPTLVLGKSKYSPGVDETIVVKYCPQDTTPIRAEFVRRIAKNPGKTVGIFEKVGQGGTVVPSYRKDNRSFFIAPSHTAGAHDGDLVEVEIIREEGRKNAEARITAVLGSLKGKAFSPTFIAIKTHGLPENFSANALQEAAEAKIPPLQGREDLRHLPLVTIDDEDARDFDDAIYAHRDKDGNNPDGWVMWVAIADVSFYVPCGSALDTQAFERGNSVYFPDQVLPMLPERLSNDLCSLKPQEERACLAVKMRIDQRGKLIDFSFKKGIMKSVTRLTYQGVQQALDGNSAPYTAEFIETVIHPLYQAYQVLRKARAQRGALEIERQEERIYLDNKGAITHIAPRPHYISHEIVEEMMILANVAAAIFLTNHHTPCLFRIHDQPDPEKVYGLAVFLRSLGIPFAKGQALRPKVFNKLLLEANKTPYAFAIQELVLRTQARAAYSPHNIGHYGLNLPRYMHFTSPIRRYADLVVHRAIATLLNSNQRQKHQAYPYTLKELEAIGEHISLTERKAATAERETIERFICTYLSTQLGQVFECRIVSVTDFGLFVEVLNNGAQGLIPLHALPRDYYDYDQKNQLLKGRRHKKNIFKLGDFLKAYLQEADPLTGKITLSALEPSSLNPACPKAKVSLKKASSPPKKTPPRRSKREAP